MHTCRGVVLSPSYGLLRTCYTCNFDAVFDFVLYWDCYRSQTILQRGDFRTGILRYVFGGVFDNVFGYRRRGRFFRFCIISHRILTKHRRGNHWLSVGIISNLSGRAMLAPTVLVFIFFYICFAKQSHLTSSLFTITYYLKKEDIILPSIFIKFNRESTLCPPDFSSTVY